MGVKVTLRIYSTSFLQVDFFFFKWNCRFHVFIALPNWKYPCTKLITPDHGLLCTQWQTSPWIQHSSLSLNSRITWGISFVFYLVNSHSFLPSIQSTLVSESCQLLVLLLVKVPSNDKARGDKYVCPVLAGKGCQVHHGSYLKKRKKSMGFILPN